MSTPEEGHINTENKDLEPRLLSVDGHIWVIQFPEGALFDEGWGSEFDPGRSVRRNKAHTKEKLG